VLDDEVFATAMSIQPDFTIKETLDALKNKLKKEMSEKLNDMSTKNVPRNML
jgi:hypothetical protein